MAHRPSESTTTRRPDLAAAVRTVLRSGPGRARKAAAGVLGDLPWVLDARWVPQVPLEEPDLIVTPLDTGGALVLTAPRERHDELSGLVETVAATVDGMLEAPVDFRDALISRMPTVAAVFAPSGEVRWTNMARWPDGTPMTLGEQANDAITVMVH